MSNLFPIELFNKLILSSNIKLNDNGLLYELYKNIKPFLFALFIEDVALIFIDANGNDDIGLIFNN